MSSEERKILGENGKKYVKENFESKILSQKLAKCFLKIYKNGEENEIITIVGARPQFVKSSIVSKRLKEKNIEEIYIHTGQHYDENMSDIFFKELEIDKPKYNLHIGSGFHGEQTGKMIIEIEKIVLEEKPDVDIIIWRY